MFGQHRRAFIQGHTLGHVIPDLTRRMARICRALPDPAPDVSPIAAEEKTRLRVRSPSPPLASTSANTMRYISARSPTCTLSNSPALRPTTTVRPAASDGDLDAIPIEDPRPPPVDQRAHDYQHPAAQSQGSIHDTELRDAFGTVDDTGEAQVVQGGWDRRAGGRRGLTHLPRCTQASGTPRFR
ncbi:hypothetical protein PG991_009909 [Apiospora marii]|uniref:Uncharacterized protein n=1 Tax=Apiospora marii TaxID=335849 RepID=A0ABR1RGY6_9PEZI